ncbi:MAG: FGGY family carbohydrate kinase [Anaerolineaceae bacterium]
MNPLIIGLDLGTTLCKAAAFELNGSLRTTAQSGINTSRPHSGWAEQNPLDWTAAIREVLKEISVNLGDEVCRVTAIGVSSHGPSLIPTDSRLQPLAMAPTWQDQRAADLCPELIKRAGTEWVGLGMPESSFAVKLNWVIKNQPELIKQAVHLLDVKGFLLATLTGRIIDETSSSPGAWEWSRSTYEQLGIDLHKIPLTVSSATVVGRLLPNLADEIGLPRSVVVIAGLNDGASATLGAGVINNGQGIVSLSTNGVMRTIVNERLPGDILVENSLFCYSFINEYYVTGGTTKCGGDSVRWFIDTFLSGYHEDKVFDQIERDASESIIGANGILFMPYLMGIGSPHSRKESQGAFLNLGRHHGRTDMTRALLEGIAFSLRDIGETFNHLNWKWDNLRFTGGGSKNKVWSQIVADVLGKPLKVVQADSVLGAAIITAVTCGYKSSIQSVVSEWVRPTFTFEPISKNVQRYNDIYQYFVRARQNLDTFLITR